jgi:hypothetical protein
MVTENESQTMRGNRGAGSSAEWCKRVINNWITIYRWCWTVWGHRTSFEVANGSNWSTRKADKGCFITRFNSLGNVKCCSRRSRMSTVTSKQFLQWRWQIDSRTFKQHRHLEDPVKLCRGDVVTKTPVVLGILLKKRIKVSESWDSAISLENSPLFSPH